MLSILSFRLWPKTGSTAKKRERKPSTALSTSLCNCYSIGTTCDLCEESSPCFLPDEDEASNYIASATPFAISETQESYFSAERWNLPRPTRTQNLAIFQSAVTSIPSKTASDSHEAKLYMSEVPCSEEPELETGATFDLGDSRSKLSASGVQQLLPRWTVSVERIKSGLDQEDVSSLDERRHSNSSLDSTSSSCSSTSSMSSASRLCSIRFSEDVLVSETFATIDYDRSNEKTWVRLSERDKWLIKQELNEFKRNMVVHEESAKFTRFHK